MEKVLVDPGWVAERLDDPGVQVIEVDVSPANYDEGHIPGATLWDAYKDLRHPDYTPIDRDELDALLERSGVGPDSRHGGRSRGLGSQRGDWSTEVPEQTRSSYERGEGRDDLMVDREELERLIDDAAAVIVDVRSTEEFSGERFWPSGATEDVGRAGHIPGAVHIPVEVIRDQ